MARISYLDCKHKNVQQFTEYCFDCGYNIWTTEKEYLEDLRKQAKTNPTIKEIRELEKQLSKKND